MTRSSLVISLCTLALLTGCQAPSRYSQAQDSAPDFVYDEPDMQDATPRYEPYREQNNLPYEVFGESYTPLLSGKGYTAEGFASWYGQKFHGHITSNGEVYDMFGMTAAHKTLPLPSYVKVTNLDNKRAAIVRVNDRGPFHSERIIDLSYAAAKKLGFHQHGTTRVKLEVIHVDQQDMVTVGTQAPVPYALFAGELPEEQSLQAASQPAEIPANDEVSPQQPTAVTKAQAASQGYYIQVAALTDIQRARQLSNGLSSLYQVPAEFPLINDIYRLRLGPLTDRFKLNMLLEELKQNGYPGAYKIAANL
ncbi:septal ring lytic transglycosylase RlpA family protein [Alteromonas lipolytica]|uniref:Endolytic peptidoglycan transglycosylase RlpA n=1 Tax=Alteromonas lipolytica TaxID=1856405 RepID=A0A1E8FGE6_9ALTE|nr:septal ring lytic transglycosylase RlpA family protein [Alteromonas lipolytica]OFI35027.1 hypothetical protein BFC17_15845 [Alteromonas lipolytica]GGF56018.1 endolytic peptidoglycan transglycosylase RlpA [Alteromonas lipolytica]